MDARFMALHSALHHLGVDSGNGLAVQKAVYLAQAAGAPLGYRFAWYARGPHSGALSGNIYLMEMALAEHEGKPTRELIEPVRKLIEGLRPCLKVPGDVDLDGDDWLELLASYHYLIAVSEYRPEAARRHLRERKPDLAAHLPEAERELERVGLA